MDYKEVIYQYYLKFRFYSKRKSFARGVYLAKDMIIGDNVTIKRNAIIGNSVIIKDNVIIGRNAVLQRIKVGKNSHIEGGVIITGNGKGSITIGEESYIGVYNVLDFSDNITIGNFVHVAGPSTGLWTHTSAEMCLNNIPLKDKDEKYRPTAPIIIEDNVYIGCNCTIYPGVTIHHHAIIAPNSAVSKDVPSYTLYGGVPARFIKKINLKLF